MLLSEACKQAGKHRKPATLIQTKLKERASETWVSVPKRVIWVMCRHILYDPTSLVRSSAARPSGNQHVELTFTYRSYQCYGR